MRPQKIKIRKQAREIRKENRRTATRKEVFLLLLFLISPLSPGKLLHQIGGVGVAAVLLPREGGSFFSWLLQRRPILKSTPFSSSSRILQQRRARRGTLGGGGGGRQKFLNRCLQTLSPWDKWDSASFRPLPPLLHSGKAPPQKENRRGRKGKKGTMRRSRKNICQQIQTMQNHFPYLPSKKCCPSKVDNWHPCPNVFGKCEVSSCVTRTDSFCSPSPSPSIPFHAVSFFPPPLFQNP